MQEYYKQRVETLSAQVELAKRGVASIYDGSSINDGTVDNAGYESVCGKAAELNHYIAAVEDLEAQLKYATEEYEKECTKLENAHSSAMEVLYGEGK